MKIAFSPICACKKINEYDVAMPASGGYKQTQENVTAWKIHDAVKQIVPKLKIIDFAGEISWLDVFTCHRNELTRGKLLMRLVIYRSSTS